MTLTARDLTPRIAAEIRVLHRTKLEGEEAFA